MDNKYLNEKCIETIGGFLCEFSYVSPRSKNKIHDNICITSKYQSNSVLFPYFDTFQCLFITHLTIHKSVELGIQYIE